MGQGKTYSQLSAASLAAPKNVALAGLVQTVFRGTTLRSMLLEAYGFWQMGQIALFAAIASFIGAGLLLLLSVIGLVHERRCRPRRKCSAKTVHATTVSRVSRPRPLAGRINLQTQGRSLSPGAFIACPVLSFPGIASRAALHGIASRAPLPRLVLPA